MKIICTMVFEVSQLPQDLILQAIVQFIGADSIYYQLNAVSHIRVASILQLEHVVIPFFSEYPLPSYKGIQYRAWLAAVEVVICDSHYSHDREIRQTALIKTLSLL